MKIALLTDGIYPYVIGGMQKHSYYLAKYLAQRDIQIDLVHCVYNQKIPENEGRNEEYFSEEELKNINFKCYQFPSFIKLPGHYLRANNALSEEIYEDFGDLWKKGTFDLVYIQGFTGYKFFKEKDKVDLPPLFINLHGFEMFQTPPSFLLRLKFILLKKAAAWHTRNADYVFSFGGMISDIIKNKIGIEEKKIIELPIGISANWLRKDLLIVSEPTAVKKFVFVGRYERRKGIQELTRSLIKLTESGTNNFEFHFIGPIPEDKRIKCDKVFYHGLLNKQEAIKEIIEKCDVFVCPSYSEGMPTVILEAMSCGLAILATDCGAVRKLVKNNGWLIKYPHVDCIYNALQEIIAMNNSELNINKINSINLVKKEFLWDNVIEQTISALEQKCNK